MHFINVLDENECSKCIACVEAKFAKKHFKHVTSTNIEMLELIHFDLADFRNTMSKGGKNNFWR